MKDCFRNLLRELATINKVILIWMPVHKVIEGNQKGDELAKQGLSYYPTGAELFCGMKMKATKAAILKCEKRETNRTWLVSPGQKHDKKIGSPDDRRTLLLKFLGVRDRKYKQL